MVRHQQQPYESKPIECQLANRLSEGSFSLGLFERRQTARIPLARDFGDRVRSLENSEDQCNDACGDKPPGPQIATSDEDGLSPIAVGAGQYRWTHDEDEDRNHNPEQHHLQHERVDWIECGSDQVTPRPDSASHRHGSAAALQDLGDLVFVERAAEFDLFLFDLRAQVFTQLGNKLLLLPCLRQPEADSLQISVNEFQRVFRSAHVLCLLKNLVQRRVDPLPLAEKLIQNLFAVCRQTVKALVALVLFAPLAHEQSLAFKPAEQRIQSPFIDLQSVIGQCFAQCVSVALRTKLCQDGQR